MTKNEKKAYHKRYYRANAIRLQALARVRYWNLVYKFKEVPVKKQEKKIEDSIKIIKGDFTIYFD